MVSWSLVGARAAAAQTTGTVDVGISTVRYDGFQPSVAIAVTPLLGWTRRATTLAASGSYLRFQSGHRSIQGLFTASAFTPRLAQRWRGELFASAGASQYLSFASFWHASGEARLHLVGERRGGWIGATGGRTSYGGAPRPLAAAGIGVWARRAWLVMTASATRSFVGDTAYSDVVTSAVAHRGRLALHASLGDRVSSRGGGHGVYGEASATLDLGDRTAVYLSGGRYPTDPPSGSVAGRYLSAGMRLWIPVARPPVLRVPEPVAPRPTTSGDDDPITDIRLEVRTGLNGSRLVVHAVTASSVELAADFTDWVPVQLLRAADGTWETALQVPSGVHRLNVRLDGGAWIAPAGTTRTADDFGNEVGIVVVP